jgi:WD40 repeat protein
VVSVLQWVEHRKVRQYDEYDLILGYGNLIHNAAMTFAPDRVQWNLKQTPFMMGNMVRTFTALDVSKDGIFVYAGTPGEMLVFRRDTGVFRACIPICSGGVQGIVTLPNDDVICAGGDGTICRVEGRDMTWRIVQKVVLDSGVKSLSLSANQSELIIGCSSGSVYRCLSNSLSSHVVSEGHSSPVTCIAFSSNLLGEGDEGTTLFATGTQSGEVRLWDLIDYACTDVCRYSKNGAVLCLFIITNDRVISGWEDGFIRCFDIKNLTYQLWYIANAHRGGVTSLSAYADQQLQYVASGGGDGAVRVWRLGSRELVTQYTEHSKLVAKVLIDVRSPNIIHSVGRDSSVLSYDIKASRRVISHLVTSSSGSSGSGSMMDMTQRLDSEQELITCDSQGRLLYWDVDYREPVMCVQDPSRSTIHCCQVSPSGQFLAFAGDDQLLKVMDLTSGEVLALGQAHSSSVKALTWTPDERQLISGGDDMSLCVWNWYLGGIENVNQGSNREIERTAAPMSNRGGSGGREEGRNIEREGINSERNSGRNTGRNIGSNLGSNTDRERMESKSGRR